MQTAESTTASTQPETRNITYAQAIREAIAEEMERDETVFMMGCDVGPFGGVFGATPGLFEQFGERRIIDTPISENFLGGGGVGAAISGLRPIVELQFADFVGVAMNEIYNYAAKWRYMHGGFFKVPLVFRLPEGAQGGAGPEHSQCPEHLFWSAPGLYVVTPADAADAKGLLKTAIRNDNPVLFFEHKGLYNKPGPVPVGEHLVPLGQALIRRPGEHVTVIAWSRMVHTALEAAELLEGEGISVEVIDPRGLLPFDLETVLRSVSKTGRVVIAHEMSKRGGSGAEVAAMIAEEALTMLEAPIVRVGAPDVPIPQSVLLEAMMVPDAADIVAAVRRVAD